MHSKLPNELISYISKLVGEDSTHDLKPLALVDQRWHAVAAPLLLATISVSSLGGVMELCKQITPSHWRDDNVTSSCIAKYTRTIVISGVKWGYDMVDCCFGLEHSGDQDEDSEEENLLPRAVPDVNLPPKDVSKMIQTAFPHLALLDSLEWYGRFAGDYCLVRYLQGANIIRHLVYGIECGVSNSSPTYHHNAFLFTGLKSVALTCESGPRDKLFDRMFQMIHHNPGLQSILYDCEDNDASIPSWRLVDLICNPSPSPADKSIVVWSNLQHLVLRFCEDSLWESAQEVEQLARFLISHPKLETLFLHEMCTSSCRIELSHPLSLGSYPDALPHLKKLLGSQRLIAGVLESRAACLSVQTVMSTTSTDDGWIHKRQANWDAPYIERIMRALEKAPENQIHRLTLEVSQLSCSFFATVARSAPNVRFLEFLEANGSDWTTSQNDDFDAGTDIPAGLNTFPKLEAIGRDIAAAFVRPFNCKRTGLLELARQVPRLRYIHCHDGILVAYVRGPDGDLDIQVGKNSLNNEDYDWFPYSVEWVHRPTSYHAMQRVWMSEMRMTELELSWIF